MAKKILGLDLGTNSIGWALINQDFENKKGEILGMGSRIIPMSQDIIDTFGSGQSYSQTANRTKARSIRKLYQRDHLRRERLHRVLNILGFLPSHYKMQIDFITHKGQFVNYAEPKLPYFLNESGKYEFLFKNTFEEMLEDFKKNQPELLNRKNKKGEPAKIPYDWTIYYLRKKALSQKISKEELAWILLNFNQKRGYYQLSGQEEETTDDKIKEFVILKIKEVVDSGEQIKGTTKKLYDIFFENGWKYDKQTTMPADWENKKKEFIVTTSTTKSGEIKRTYKSVDSEKDWIAIKKKSEQDIEKSKVRVGTYIYETLLNNPKQKIRGRLVRTIERKFYKEELKQILDCQISKHSELEDRTLYSSCIRELYPNNESHKKNIENRGFSYLFINDIIFYQRPLKSKTHLISDCPLEQRIRKDNGEKVAVKCIAKSNPLFQEFRLWQFLSNLKLYEKEREVNGKIRFDINVTSTYLSSEEKWTELFEWLNDKESISQKQLLGFFKLKEDKYRWNNIEDKEYPCNETRAKLLIRLKKADSPRISILTSETVHHLWHILFSVTDPEFSHKYQIEHIFPQSRHFNDSLSNKIICESEVNQLKDNRTAYEFIKEFGGIVVDLAGGETIKIHTHSDYENHVKTYFVKNKIKRDSLLSADIPESFINRQMNDSRYISKTVKNLLSKIVRDEDEKEVTSKHIVPINGAITAQMRKDWGLNDIWNDIIIPRFERMNTLTKSKDFGEVNPNTNKFLPKAPDSLSKKRIDHRHHALDALVIACITREHVNYITSINTERKNYSLVNKLRKTAEIEKIIQQKDGTQAIEKRKVAKDFYKPWESFTQDARKKLETTVISFKQNLRVINKTKNRYEKFIKDEKEQLNKKIVPQTKGENWAIRKALHKDTIYGKVTLKRKGETFEATAGRVELSEKFTRKHLESITDTGIQTILENHVKNYIDDKGKEQFELSFNPEGIDRLNENIILLNNGISHQPVYKVRIYEEGSRFAVGHHGNKKDKYVESAKGTNLFFAIYKGKNKKGEITRQYSTIPLNEVIESLKQGSKPAPDKYFDKDKNEYAILFTLSPNDLVYVPTIEEQENSQLVDFSNLTKEQTTRIYKMEKASGSECYFVRNDIASLIKQYDAKSKLGELSSQNKLETTMDIENSIRIKEVCWKLETNRLGQIKKVIK